MTPADGQRARAAEHRRRRTHADAGAGQAAQDAFFARDRGVDHPQGEVTRIVAARDRQQLVEAKRQMRHADRLAGADHDQEQNRLGLFLAARIA